MKRLGEWINGHAFKVDDANLRDFDSITDFLELYTLPSAFDFHWGSHKVSFESLEGRFLFSQGIKGTVAQGTVVGSKPTSPTILRIITNSGIFAVPSGYAIITADSIETGDKTFKDGKLVDAENPSTDIVLRPIAGHEGKVVIRVGNQYLSTGVPYGYMPTKVGKIFPTDRMLFYTYGKLFWDEPTYSECGTVITEQSYYCIIRKVD